MYYTEERLKLRKCSKGVESVPNCLFFPDAVSASKRREIAG